MIVVCIIVGLNESNEWKSMDSQEACPKKDLRVIMWLAKFFWEVEKCDVLQKMARGQYRKIQCHSE